MKQSVKKGGMVQRDSEASSLTRIQMMVSTVITSYNKGELLAKAIESALAQDYTPHEIIVVDDGSTDNTREIASRFRDRIRYIYQDNRGQACARNVGIRDARGEFIAFLDGDDRWCADKLRKQISVFQGRSEVGVVYSPMIPFSDASTGPTWTIGVPANRLRRGNVLESILVHNFVPFSSAVVRHSAVRQAGMFDETRRVADDYDLWLRVAREHEFDFVEEPLVAYWEGDNRIGTRFGTKFEYVMRIQQNFLDRFYPNGFPNPAAIRTATARKYAEHGDWLLAIGHQLDAFRAHLYAAWYEPWRWERCRALLRDLVPNRVIGALKRGFREKMH